MGQNGGYGMTFLTSAFNFALQEISNAISHNRNKKTAKEFMALENQYLRSNMDYQNQMNINNYNQFESPAAQRRLLTEAGYNPMLAQNNFSGNIGTASASAPHQAAPQRNATQVLPIDLAADYMSLKSMKLGLEKQKLENEELRVNIENIKSNTNKNNSDVNIANQMLPLNKQILQGTIDMNELDKQLKSIEIQSVDSSLQKQILYDTLDMFKASETMSYYNDNPTVYRKVLDAQTNILLAELENKKLTNKLTKQQIAKLNADTQTVLMQNKVIQRDTDAYVAWFDGLTPEEKEQVTKAKQNLIDEYGEYFSTQQIETMLHRSNMLFEQGFQMEKLDKEIALELVQMSFDGMMKILTLGGKGGKGKK